MKVLNELRREPILLAHHPLCGRFEDHFIMVRGRRLCRGCLTVYPSAALWALALWSMGASFLPSLVLAVSLFTVQLLRAVPTLRGLSVPFNIMLGMSLASVMAAMLLCPPGQRIVLYPLVLGVASAFVYLKGRRVFLVCRECPDRASFPRCARGSDFRNGKARD